MNRAPGFHQAPREQTALPEPPRVVTVVTGLRFERQVKRFRRRGTEQPVRILQRPSQRFLLIVAAELSDRAGIGDLLIRFEPRLKPFHAHPLRRADGVHRLFGIRQQKRSEFAPQKSGRVKRLQLFAFARVKSLPNINERRHRRIAGAERPSNHGPDVRRGDCLRRSVAGVPVILMSRMQHESQIAGGVRANQARSVHHRRDVLQPLRNLDVIHRRIDRGKRAEHLVRRHPGRKRRVFFRIEGFGGRHPAPHPQHNHGIGGGLRRRLVLRQNLPRRPGGQSPDRRGTGGLQKSSAVYTVRHRCVLVKMSLRRKHLVARAVAR